MTPEPVASLDDPRVTDYRDLGDPAALRNRGLFVAEGRLVVRTLLEDRRYRVRSLLLSPAALEGLHGALEGRDDVTVYVTEVEQLSAIVGFNMHRGCVGLAERPETAPPGALIASVTGASLLVVTEHIANADNVGGIFRNALAFGAGAVLLSPDCCDPLYRKAIRVSIGGSLRVPFSIVDEWPRGLAVLKQAGYRLVALTPDAKARELGLWAVSARPRRVALLLGHEGSGLSEAALAMADDRVRIEMAARVDSLNVATAAGIAMYVCSGLWRHG
ncbi:MAG: RNA methyltransferase [Acidobacteriota bacterium]